jgi:hypothetical protein
MSREALVKKWEDAKGKVSIKEMQDQYLKENMAVLLENQERKDWNGRDIFLEASQAANTTVSLSQLGYTFPAGTQDPDAYRFRPVALALVRRTFPELFANKVVGVQAMSTPVGLAYALRVVYNDGNNQEAAWDSVDYYGGYTGSTPQASADLDSSSGSGIYDTSATGAVLSAAEAFQLGTANTYPQLKMRIDKVSIEAATRKLAASFSLESAQDIKAMHDIDIEREMLNVIQYESIAEMDRELLYRMKKASIDTTIGGEIISTINCSGTAALDGRWSQERYANIVAAIINQANRIAIKTRRGPGNFVVVSPQMATVLQASGHPFTRLHSAANATTTVAEIGMLNDSLTVYRDVYAKTDYALVGFKGPGISDCGIIFSPYIMGLTSKAIDPTDFSPRIGVMARYAITDTLLGSGRYYRLLPFSNVGQIIAGGSNL